MSMSAPPIYQPYNLTTGGAPLDVQLGFQAYAVIIDNLTPNWVYVADADRYVMPGTVGAIFPLGGTTRGTASFLAPAGFGNPSAPVVPQQCKLIFTSDVLSYNPGSVAPQSGPQPRSLIDKITYSADGGQHSKTVTLPAGTIGLMTVTDTTVMGGTVTAVGATTLIPFPSRVNGAFTYFDVEINASQVDFTTGGPDKVDTQVTVTVTAPTGGGASVGTVAIFAILRDFPSILASPQSVVPTSALGLVVADISFAALAGNGKAHIIAGKPNVSVTIFRGLATFQSTSALSAARLQSSGTSVVYGEMNFQSTPGPFLFDWATGVVLPVGEGLDVFNTAGAAMPNINGVIVYSQPGG